MKRTLLAALCLMGMLCTGVSAADEYLLLTDEPPDVPPGAGMGAAAGYTRREPGHWEKTDTLYFGPLEQTRTVDGVTVAADFADTNNGRGIVYTFTGADGAQSVYTVESFWFEEEYYADDSFSVGVNIIRQPDEDGGPGGISASLAVADVTLGEGEYGFQPSVRSYFTKANGTVIERFDVGENMTFSTGSEGKYYINPYAKFPVGETDGQKLYALLGVQDELDRGTRLFIAYEYQWVERAEEIEVPAQYGPIEYFDDPVPAAQRSPLLMIVPVPLAAGVAVLVIRAIRKK